MMSSDPNPMQTQDQGIQGRPRPNQSKSKKSQSKGKGKKASAASSSAERRLRRVTDWWLRTRLWRCRRCRKTTPPHNCAEVYQMAICRLHVTTQKAKLNARLNMSSARRSQTRSCVWRQQFAAASGMQRHISRFNSRRKWSQAPWLLRCSATQLIRAFQTKDLLASRHSLRLWGPALHWEFRFHHSCGPCRIWPLHSLWQFRLGPEWLRATRRMQRNKSHQSSQEGAACVAVAEHPQRKRPLSAPAPSHQRSWKSHLAGRRRTARQHRRRCKALLQMQLLHLLQMCRYLLAGSRHSKKNQNWCLH
mmetsp:Transcript_48837/g.114771  ORF Transcript_48837/g.114771 Transcript_48837/m.114771 type:complete len:305 (+) Transcript_48837:175-1089(+)